MKLAELSQDCGEWLRGAGDEKIDASGAVISCRVRLARNLSAFNFMSRLKPLQRAEVLKRVREAVATLKIPDAELAYFDLEQLSEIECTFLLERHLVSRDLAESRGARGVVFDRREKLSIMINEEDHLRLQALGGGQILHQIYEYLNHIDDELSNFLDFAWSPDLGYLTACPSNVGTGMRVSAMLHLPGLTISRQIEKIFRAVTDLHLAVRGYYGEGTRADGDLFQISNQITLGRQESELIDDMVAMVNQINDYEMRARDFLWREQRLQVEDRVWRSLAILREARVMTSDEAMSHLSNLRLGTALGIISTFDTSLINRLLLASQPAHLQIAAGREMTTVERDEARATRLRTALRQDKNGND